MITYVLSALLALSGPHPGETDRRPRREATPATFVVPADGTFHIARKPAFKFEATLKDGWSSGQVGAGTLHVYAPVLPELPGQGKLSTRLSVAKHDKLKAKAVEEKSQKRPMLEMSIPSEAISAKEVIPVRLEYSGTLYERTLKRSPPQSPVPALSEDERRRYLMSSITMDHDNAEFAGWMRERGLVRRSDEDVTAFGHRTFVHFIENGVYGGDTSSYEARRPSRVCHSFTNDCGGLALLFVAVMRSNGVPARTLFGRWAIPQTDAYGQFHVMAEFFVEKSGWVPVDVSGTIVHKPNDRNAHFGNADGQLIVFHVDTDLEPASDFRHAWAQYLLLNWVGEGNFWAEPRHQSAWEVVRRPVKD